jgi:hypothetical protein
MRGIAIPKRIDCIFQKKKIKKKIKPLIIFYSLNFLFKKKNPTKQTYVIVSLVIDGVEPKVPRGWPQPPTNFQVFLFFIFKKNIVWVFFNNFDSIPIKVYVLSPSNFDFIQFHSLLF